MYLGQTGDGIRGKFHGMGEIHQTNSVRYHIVIMTKVEKKQF
ncbi:hypothetical protein [Neobacillus niacini]|nr:hypothetical protein [Neobacillus niacini]MDR7001154.1 hypothetical protein [Neobacillus niacini]